MGTERTITRRTTRPTAVTGRTVEVTYLAYQLAVFDCRARNVVYVKGRRAGGTMGAAHRLIELAINEGPTRHLWIDTVQRNIHKYVERYFRPRLRGVAARWDPAGLVLWLPGGSVCDFGSMQNPGRLEGFSYEYLWVNEAGHVLRNERLYQETLLPMLLERGMRQAFLIGTPKGRGLFETLYERGQDPLQPDWASFRHPTTMNFLLSADAVAEMRRQVPEAVWRQEVLAEFLDDGGAVFARLEAAAAAEPEAAPEPGAPYVIGLDLARYEDFTVAWVGRADTRTAVHCERFRRLPWQQQMARVVALARRYGEVTVYADATGVGDAVCETLARTGVAVEPVVLTAQRKRQLVEHLALGLEGGALRMVPHEATLAELRAFSYRTLPTGHTYLGAPAGGHDDCVIALALCHWGMSAEKGELILGPQLVSRESDY